MINGSTSVLLKLNLIQPKRHKAMPMLPIINNGSVIIRSSCFRKCSWSKSLKYLKKGDFLLVNKFAYGLKVNRIGMPNFLKNEPQYGDAVVIIPPHNPVPYIKRLVGKPGDMEISLFLQLWLSLNL